jgi:hypothetical protein
VAVVLPSIRVRPEAPAGGGSAGPQLAPWPARRSDTADGKAEAKKAAAVAEIVAQIQAALGPEGFVEFTAKLKEPVPA